MQPYRKFMSFMMAIMIGLTLAKASPAQNGYLSQEGIRPKKIEWKTNLYAAYKQSLAERKPLVVFFYVYNGNYSTQFAQEVLYNSRMNVFADRAIFARIDVETDDAYGNVSKMINSLGLKEYPVVAVLDSGQDKIVERGHLTGYQRPEVFYAFFNNLLLKNSSVLGSTRK
jgi:hypothetical protein